MKPTALMMKMASKMTNAELAKALATTHDEIRKNGGSIKLQSTRWQMLTALKAEAATRAW